MIELKDTHRKGDLCPEDMFVVTPPEAFVSATFQRSVELRGDKAPYHVLYDGATDEEGAPIFLDIVPGMKATIDGQGLMVEDVSQSSRWAGIQLGGQEAIPTQNLKLQA